MTGGLKQRLLMQLDQLNEDVSRAMAAKDLARFNDARDRRLLVQAQLDALASAGTKK